MLTAVRYGYWDWDWDDDDDDDDVADTGLQGEHFDFQFGF